MTHEIIHKRRGECEVKRFAEAMIEKLNEPKNLAKSSWNNFNTRYLFDLLQQEVSELRFEIIGDNTDKNVILKECADVANFAMFIADKVGALK
jgi:hypothetical protein